MSERVYEISQHELDMMYLLRLTIGSVYELEVTMLSNKVSIPFAASARQSRSTASSAGSIYKGQRRVRSIVLLQRCLGGKHTESTTKSDVNLLSGLQRKVSAMMVYRAGSVYQLADLPVVQFKLVDDS